MLRVEKQTSSRDIWTYRITDQQDGRTLIDHLLTFASEAAAQTDPIVGAYWIVSDSDSPGGWRGDVCIPAVSVYTKNADGSRNQSPGWFIVISLPALDPALQNAGNGTACVLIADRDAANAGNANFILYAPGLSQQQLAATFVEPTFAGSNYPFGVG